MIKLTILLCFFMLLIVNSLGDVYERRQAYVIYMSELPPIDMDRFANIPNRDAIVRRARILQHRNAIVRSLTGHSYAPHLVVKDYSQTFNGFMAHLTDEELKKVAAMSDVISIFPDVMLHPMSYGNN